ncbi:hypothetical protein [Vulcanisaeta souniana]|nr:hypothetical protein [Vulcanisaeta souniana]GGI72668.1 hypothetical protein GCM10007112_06880 [Vulcanisaeta souniana JCM 11219]
MENDYVIIIDEEARIPCCMATINRIRVSQVNGKTRVYIYLMHCDVLNEATMNRVMRIMRSVDPIITIINANQDLCG